MLLCVYRVATCWHGMPVGMDYLTFGPPCISVCYPEAVAAREVAFQHIISGGNHGCDDFGDEKVC